MPGFNPLEYYCVLCKRIKPWYRFKWGVVEKSAVCFSCNKNGWLPTEGKLRVRLESKLKTLIYTSMKNKMSDLRNHLFETLEKVKDNDMEYEKAKSICEIAQIIINSAKVEVEYIKAMGGKVNSGFIESQKVLENSES